MISPSFVAPPTGLVLDILAPWPKSCSGAPYDYIELSSRHSGYCFVGHNFDKLLVNLSVHFVLLQQYLPFPQAHSCTFFFCDLQSLATITHQPSGYFSKSTEKNVLKPQGETINSYTHIVYFGSLFKVGASYNLVP